MLSVISSKGGATKDELLSTHIKLSEGFSYTFGRRWSAPDPSNNALQSNFLEEN